VSRGAIVQQSHVVVDRRSGVALVVRVLADDPAVHIITTTGPLDTANGFGQEAVLQLRTAVPTQGAWQTDANGLQMMLRTRRNNRTTANYTVYEPAAQNYYPATAMAALRDQSATNSTARRGLSLAFAAAHGVTSPVDGTLELMLHRRLVDHGCRVDEGYQMDDTHRVIGTVRAQAPLLGDLAAAYRLDALRALHPVALFFAPGQTRGGGRLPASGGPTETHAQGARVPLPLPAADLPRNVHLHTFRALGTDLQCDPFALDVCESSCPRVTAGEVELLVRFQHLFGGEDGDPVLGRPASVDVEGFLSRWGIPLHVEETTLTAARVLPPSNSSAVGAGLRAVMLLPLQIRTFLVHMQLA